MQLMFHTTPMCNGRSSKARTQFHAVNKLYPGAPSVIVSLLRYHYTLPLRATAALRRTGDRTNLQMQRNKLTNEPRSASKKRRGKSLTIVSACHSRLQPKLLSTFYIQTMIQDLASQVNTMQCMENKIIRQVEHSLGNFHLITNEPNADLNYSRFHTIIHNFFLCYEII